MRSPDCKASINSILPHTHLYLCSEGPSEGPIDLNDTFPWDVSFPRSLEVWGEEGDGEWVVVVQIDSDYRSHEYTIWATLFCPAMLNKCILAEKVCALRLFSP